VSAAIPPELTCRRLEARDLPAVIALHHRMRATLPRDLIAFETDAFFADHIQALGCIYGCFAGEELAAYAVLGLPGPDDANFGVDHGLSLADLRLVAHLDGAAVIEPWQGQGLQRALSVLRMREARRHGRQIMLSTAAPLNIPSLANLLLCGFEVRGLVEKFGGARFLMRRDLLPGEEITARDGFPDFLAGPPVPLKDMDGHRVMLAQGRRGVALDVAHQSLVYHP